MKHNQKFDNDETFIIAYLYDELNKERRLAFEQRLKEDSAFRQLFNRQRELEQLMPVGSRPIIDEKRADAVRWALQKRLRTEVRQQNWLTGILSNLWQAQISFKVQIAGMAATFILGFVLSQQVAVDLTSSQPSFAQLDNESPLSLVKDEDYQITDLQLERLDPASGEVKVVYSLASQTRVDGNLASSQIQNLLAATIQNDVSDATRLDLIEVLQDYSSTQEVQKALSYSLLNDPNPGVRMAAAESLAKLSNDKAVRKILRQSLQQDVNPGVRVEAFQALSEHLEDPETLKIFKEYSSKDSNEYIRNKAKNLVIQQSQSKKTRI